MLPIPTRGNYSYFLKRNLGQESSRIFRLMIDQLPCVRFGIQILAGLRPCQACMHVCACSVASAMSVSFQPRGLSMGFSRRKYWSGLQCPSPGGRPVSGLEPTSPDLQVDSSSAEPCGKPNHVRYYGSFRAKAVSGIEGPPRSASPSLYPEPSPPALSSLQIPVQLSDCGLG